MTEKKTREEKRRLDNIRTRIYAETGGGGEEVGKCDIENNR